MSSQTENGVPPNNDLSFDLKSWVMVAFTFIFILLYVLALTGRLESLREWEMVTRLEPVIFVIIGYYFGRFPAQQNEQTLKEEINRQMKKAEAAQHSKEQVAQERESLEEKVKNTKAVLDSRNSVTLSRTQSNNGFDKNHGKEDASPNLLINAAINILNS